MVHSVIVYAVEPLVTLNMYTCQSFIEEGALTVKFALGVIVVFRDIVTVAQVAAVALKSA